MPNTTQEALRDAESRIERVIGHNVSTPKRVLKWEDSQAEEVLSYVQENHEPADERIDHYELVERTFDLPVVRVWCKSRDFNYNNSRMWEDSTYHNGKKKRFYVDIRPF